MMIGTGTLSYGQARGMCQSRETQRRIWRKEHGRRWHSRIDPTGLVAYKWGAISADAYTISVIRDLVPTENGVENTARNSAENTLEGVPEAREPDTPKASTLA